MFSRPVLAFTALLTAMSAAPAQSITGFWVDPDNNLVHVNASSAQYRGVFSSGPAKDHVALVVTADGQGAFKGRRYTYEARDSSHDVTARFVSGALQILVCGETAQGGWCKEDQTWQRQPLTFQVQKLPPKIRDEIRKPKPPPVIRRPDVKLIKPHG